VVPDVQLAQDKGVDAGGTSREAGVDGVVSHVSRGYRFGLTACAPEGVAAKDACMSRVSGIQSAMEEVRPDTGKHAWLWVLHSILEFCWGRVLGSKKAWGGLWLGKGDK